MQEHRTICDTKCQYRECHNALELETSDVYSYVACPECYTWSINNLETESWTRIFWEGKGEREGEGEGEERERQAEISSEADFRAVAGTGLEFEYGRDLTPTGAS